MNALLVTITTLLVTLNGLAWSAASFGRENGGSYYGGSSCAEAWEGWWPFFFIAIPIFILATRWFDKKLGNRRR